MSQPILENVLRSYKGTLLYVSHDRYFINETATRILELTGKQLINYIGNYDYYLEKRDVLQPTVNEIKDDDTGSQKNSDTKEDWLKQKSLDADRRNSKRR